MNQIEIDKLYDSPASFAGQTIAVAGWARSIRSSNQFGFIELNDGSCFRGLQIVFESGRISNYKEVASQNSGTAFVITGLLTLTPEAKQPFELKADSIVIEGASAPDYPLQKKRHSFEYLRTIAHLRPRTNTFNAVFRVRSECAFAIHEFFHRQGFVYVHTPIITTSDCEGSCDMFRVTTLDGNGPGLPDGGFDYTQDFFGKEAYLTVSGQLAAETYAMAFGKVYTFGPAFRAEHSNTPRHAAEFWMVEPEIAFADLADDMRLAEDMLKYVINHLLARCPAELAFFNERVDHTLLNRLENISQHDFARMSYTEAIERLKKSGEAFAYEPVWGSDLQTEHERYLTEKIAGRPVFVTDWPKEIKAFYMRLNDDEKTVAAMDLLVPGVGELIGGSQREERLAYLTRSYERFGLVPEAYDWYTDLRKYGSAKHAGFGLGFERLVMYVTGMNNIRDVEAYPRTVGNAAY
ncbi:MAG: asparagine--tRNA ligase [Clostridiales bacterium]|nr:asparagine--tRNA ligase [Clostridiales bacterium]